MAKKIKREAYPAPDLQECKLIILHVIKQAIKDYEHYREKQGGEEEQFIYETARDFLFDDDYMVQWGDTEMCLRQFCDILDIDIDWLRNKVVQKFDIKFLKDGRIVPKRKF